MFVDSHRLSSEEISKNVPLSHRCLPFCVSVMPLLRHMLENQPYYKRTKEM